MREQSWAGKLWEMLSPILLYELLIIVYSKAFELLTGGPPQDAEAAMGLLTLENLLMLPVFWPLYRGERRKGEPQRRKERDMPQTDVKEGGLVPKDVFVAILGAVCLSRGVNYFLALTPLPYWFSGYEAASESIYQCGLLYQVAVSVISAPLLEEVLMCGLIYERLKNNIGKPRTAMVVSALIFGLFHGNVVQGVYAFIMGLFFVRLYEACDSLLLAVPAHMAANGASVLAGQVVRPDGGYGNPAFYYFLTAAFLLAGARCWRYFVGRAGNYRRNIRISFPYKFR